jgi:hypothetical protein
VAVSVARLATASDLRKLPMANSAALTSLQLNGPPAIRLISSTRRFIQDLCATLVDPETSSRVALAAHELMENLAKHSNSGPTDLTIEVGQVQGETRILVRTSNRATPRQRDELQRVLKLVCSAEEPMTMYMGVIADSLEREEGSGLGLARIRAEAGMNLTCTIADDEVIIAAETGVDER